MYDVGDDATEPVGAPAPAAPRPGAPLDRARLRLEIRRHRSWIAVGLVAGAVAALPVARTWAPLAYVAHAAVLWERPPTTAEAGEAPRALRTMVDSIELPSNLAKVQRRLGLRETVPEIGAAIDVTFDLQSNLVTVSSRAKSGAAAARLANAVVEEFVAQRRAVEDERRSTLADALQRDLGRANGALDEAEEALQAFRTEHAVTDLDVETARAVAEVARLRAEAEQARAEAAAEDTRARALRSQARELASRTVVEVVRETPAPTEDQERLAGARAELAEIRARSTPEHPDVQVAEARVAALEDAVRRSGTTGLLRESSRTVAASEQAEALRGTIAGTVAQRDVARERLRTLGELADEAQRRLAILTAAQGRYDALVAARRVAAAHVTELEGLRARAEDEARASSTGLRVVVRASPPARPESRFARNATLVAVPLLGGLAGLLAVLAASLRGLRAWTAREVAFWGAAPVVGSTGWPHARRSVEDVWDELADQAGGARGVTLVVGATRADADLAHDVTEVLEELEAAAAPRPDPVIVDATVEPDGSPASGSEAVAEVVGSSASPVPSPGAYSFVDSTRRTPARRPSAPHPLEPRPPVETPATVASPGQHHFRRAAHETWRGPPSGPAARRAARLADRVLVVVRSGALSFREVARIRTRLGRTAGLAYLLVGVRPDLVEAPDRAGDVEGFWRSSEADEATR